MMNIVKNPAAAEEITQNTFVKAMTTKVNTKGHPAHTPGCARLRKISVMITSVKMAELQMLWNQRGRQCVLPDVTEDFVVRETSLSIHRIFA